MSLSVERKTVLPALPDPGSSTVAALHDQCRYVESWMNSTTNVDRLVEVKDWLAGVEKYLEAKQAQGPAQTTARLLEARIGELLGPADNRGPATVSRDSRLDRWERHEFRLMAQRRDVWEDKLPLPRRRVMRLIREDEADARPMHERPVELMSDIRLGDFRSVLSDLPDESLDLILTDPPYPAEFLPLWTDLAVFAKQKLAPHGVLAAMSGQTHLPEVYRRLGEHLTYRWTMAYLTLGASYQAHHRNVTSQWKPILVYGSNIRRLHDVATSRAPDKDYHGWGQSETGMYDLLTRLADPGATVCDPFVGGGTTALVSAAHGCHFVGAEIDADAHRVATKRVA